MVPTQSRYVFKPLKGIAGLGLLWLSYEIWLGWAAILPRDSVLNWAAAITLGWLGLRWLSGFLELNPEMEKPAAA